LRNDGAVVDRMEEVHGVGRPRALFFGTPELSVPSLEALASLADVVGVVCQPDKPVGRGMNLAAPPVKVRATAMGLPVVQPTKLRTGEFGAWVREQRADVALVIAYGRILPQDVLDGPRLGCVNVHASILPRYRGAAPIAWAVVRGEKETGVTLMKMDAGMDTGDVLEIRRTPIGEDETAGELGARLALLGAEAVREGLPRYLRGELAPTPQDAALATTAPLLTKEMGRIDWTKTAAEVHDHVRGMNPWPMGFCFLARGASSPVPPQGKQVRVIVHRTSKVEGVFAAGARPGTVVLADKTRVVVACGAGHVALERVQLEGKKPMTGAAWFLGRGVAEGDALE
jgi:methionyl-tRNA formyltransferase